MWQRKPGFNVSPGAGSAWGSSAHLVAGFHTVTAAGTGCHAAEGILPVVMSAAVAAPEPVACHGMIDVAALYMSAAVAGGGWDVGLVPVATKRN